MGLNMQELFYLIKLWAIFNLIYKQNKKLMIRCMSLYITLWLWYKERYTSIQDDFCVFSIKYNKIQTQSMFKMFLDFFATLKISVIFKV